jgi:hypothetical protein
LQGAFSFVQSYQSVQHVNINLEYYSCASRHAQLADFMLMCRVKGTDVIFLEIRRIDRDPIVFEVIIRGRTCVMKLVKASAEPRIGLY